MSSKSFPELSKYLRYSQYTSDFDNENGIPIIKADQLYSNHHQTGIFFPFDGFSRLNIPFDKNLQEESVLSHKYNIDDHLTMKSISQVFFCVNRLLTLSKETPHVLLQKPDHLIKDLIVIIPANNEELTIGMVVLISLQYALKVIVVDDGSEDRTGEVAKLAGAEVIRLPLQRGKNASIRVGLERAQEIGNKAVVVIDGNGLYNPHEIPYLATLALEGEADLVIGSRFLRNPNIISSYQFTGKNPGFVVFSEIAVDRLLDASDNIFESDIARYFSNQGLNVAEIPITIRKKLPLSQKIEKIIIAMPAYNEEKNLPSVIKGALEYSNTVLVVDDGSSDKTAIVAEESGAIVVRHEHNLGYGGALNTIFTTARCMDADALVIIDSDGQHNPADIQKFIDKLEKGADVVIGSRFLQINNIIPMYRKFGMKILDIFTNAAGVEKVSDSQSGFRAYGRKAISVLNIYGRGMSAGSEILIQISENGLKMEEVPINVRYDIEDTSTHNPLFHGLSVLSNILGLINFKNPIIIFGILSVFLITVSILGLFSFVFLRDYFLNPLIFSQFFWITLLLVGLISGCEGYIYHYYINKSKMR